MLITATVTYLPNSSRNSSQAKESREKFSQSLYESDRVCVCGNFKHTAEATEHAIERSFGTLRKVSCRGRKLNMHICA